MQSFSQEEQSQLYTVASAAQSLSREGSEEASREGRRRANRTPMNKQEKKNQKLRDEVNLLNGKRERKRNKRFM